MSLIIGGYCWLSSVVQFWIYHNLYYLQFVLCYLLRAFWLWGNLSFKICSGWIEDFANKFPEEASQRMLMLLCLLSSHFHVCPPSVHPPALSPSLYLWTQCRAADVKYFKTLFFWTTLTSIRLNVLTSSTARIRRLLLSSFPAAPPHLQHFLVSSS